MNMKHNQIYLYSFSCFPSSLHSLIYSFSRFSKDLWSFRLTFHNYFPLKTIEFFLFPVQPLFCYILYLIPCSIFFPSSLISNYFSSLLYYLLPSFLILFILNIILQFLIYLLAAFKSAFFHQLKFCILLFIMILSLMGETWKSQDGL